MSYRAWCSLAVMTGVVVSILAVGLWLLTGWTWWWVVAGLYMAPIMLGWAESKRTLRAQQQYRR